MQKIIAIGPTVGAGEALKDRKTHTHTHTRSKTIYMDDMVESKKILLDVPEELKCIEFLYVCFIGFVRPTLCIT